MMDVWKNPTRAWTVITPDWPKGGLGSRDREGREGGCQVDIMRLRHAPLQLREVFHSHVSKQPCHNHVSSVKNKPWYLLFFPSSLLSPAVIMKTLVFEENNNKQVAKEDIGGWQGQVRTKHLHSSHQQKTIILKNSSHCPAANHLPLTAGVHLGKVQPGCGSLQYSVFLDQWLFKGHSRPYRSQQSNGKMPSEVYTLPFLPFLLRTMNPSERDIQSKGVRLNSKDFRGSHTQP